AKLRFHVICGATGTGKSRLLEALAKAGAQVLDLEALAAHRGSVLGDLPGAPQPSQKSFETAIWTALSGFEPARPVYVESESRKVGNLRVPERLIERMRASRCFRLEAPEPSRVALLLEEYAHFIQRPGVLAEKLRCLEALHGAARIEAWIGQLERGEWRPLVSDLLASHYDPAYRRSLERNYKDAASATPLAVADIRPEGFLAMAKTLLAQHG
ncbi:MAG TPA: tRNA 2-selenouridine(34) synthase MnmH, partial [Usitatibacter sp.]|nr:tRNA 2-selenouridine(34) synthase MnmH [Usitatibacter sp.]